MLYCHNVTHNVTFISILFDFLKNFIWLMTISDSPLLGEFASELNFDNDSGRSPLAD